MSTRWLSSKATFFAALCAAGCNLSHIPEATKSLTGSVPLVGYWQNLEDGEMVVSFDAKRRTDFVGGLIGRTGRILEETGDQMRLCVYGRDTYSRAHVTAGLLTIVDADSPDVRRFRRLSGPPPGLKFQVIELPSPQELPTARVEAIQKEIGRRFREDVQAERATFGSEIGVAKPQPADPIARLHMIDIATQNRKYLESLLESIGWIDAERFGYPTSNAALLMVQHSGDPLLLETVLPWIKRDVEARLIDGEAYALVYDRLQLLLGEKQKYATQIGRDENGLPLVYPTEAPERVDELRKSMGLSPLSEYIKLFGGTEVRFSSACSISSEAGSLTSR